MKKKLILIFISIIIWIIIGILFYYLGEFLEKELILEKPTEQYVKMKEINDNRTLIGLSKEGVKEILGEPVKIYTYVEEVYMYNAGYIYDGIFGSQKHNYVVYITFEETGMVKSTIIKERP
ncbi:MAG: hypothetical protein HFJ30_04560 [Clostridia bacterium]|jgi:hypothetical protein|nr:hypothetical protein [Clostridia bacterium]